MWRKNPGEAEQQEALLVVVEFSKDHSGQIESADSGLSSA